MALPGLAFLQNPILFLGCLWRKSMCLENNVHQLTVFVDPIHYICGNGDLLKNFHHSFRRCSIPKCRPPHLHQLASLQNKNILHFTSPLLLPLFFQRDPSCQSPRQSRARRQGVAQNLNKICFNEKSKCWWSSPNLGDEVLLSPPPWSGSVWVSSQLSESRQIFLGLDALSG